MQMLPFPGGHQPPSVASCRRKRGLVLVTALLAMASWTGCGGDGEVAPTPAADSARTAQHAITTTEWQAVLDGDAGLAALAAKVGMPFQAAGVVNAVDGRKLTWGEYAASAEAAREKVVALFQRCDPAGVCSIGQGSHTAQGVALVAADGKALSNVKVGGAILHKVLKNHNLTEGKTELRLALKRKHIVDRKLADFYGTTVDQGTRRLVILSAYGEAVGIPFTRLRKMVEAADHFDRVVLLEFARRRDLQDLLPTMTPQDVLVWIGAGVLEPFEDKPAKSVGMTLSRGIFGDELVHRKHLDKILDAPILGGPGLVVLVGSNSLTAAHPNQTGLLAQALHQAPYRPVVGFDGSLTAKTAENGAMALLKALFDGESLSTALTAGGKAAMVPMSTLLPQDQRKIWRLPVTKAKFWSTPPKSAKLQLYVKNTPKCVKLPAGSVCTEQGFKTGSPIPPEQLTAAHVAFTCDVTFDGPWLACQADNPTTGATFKLRGVMTGQAPGDAVLLMVTGAPSQKMTGVTFVGEGVIEAAEEKKGRLTIRFGGDAAGSTWLDNSGNCCIAVTPLLIGNQSQRSILTIER